MLGGLTEIGSAVAAEPWGRCAEGAVAQPSQVGDGPRGGAGGRLGWAEGRRGGSWAARRWARRAAGRCRGSGRSRGEGVAVRLRGRGRVPARQRLRGECSASVAGEEEAGVVAEAGEEVGGRLEEGGGGVGRLAGRAGGALAVRCRHVWASGAASGRRSRGAPGWLQETVRVTMRPLGALAGAAQVAVGLQLAQGGGDTSCAFGEAGGEGLDVDAGPRRGATGCARPGRWRAPRGRGAGRGGCRSP